MLTERGGSGEDRDGVEWVLEVEERRARGEKKRNTNPVSPSNHTEERKELQVISLSPSEFLPPKKKTPPLLPQKLHTPTQTSEIIDSFSSIPRTP